MGYNTKKYFSTETEKLKAKSRQIFKMSQKFCVKLNRNLQCVK